MTSWLIRRLIQAVFVVLAMTIIVFIGIYAIGDPLDILVPPDADQLSRERAAQAFGLDQPLWLQYIRFLGGILQGDFGTSFVFNTSSLELILERLPATLELAVAAVLLSIVIGIPLGLYAGLRPRSILSRVLMTGSILGFSLPSFWVGLMLITIFSMELGWLPSSGRGDTREVLGVNWSFLTLDGLSHMFLPALNLSLVNIALVMRLTRAGVSEVLQADYIRFARAKGLSERRIVTVHVMKNIMIPIVTVIGIDFGSTIAFAVVTENIFSWPGMGKLIIDSINVLDRPVIVAYMMVTVVLFVTVNLIVDFLYTLLDPRIRLGEQK
ncbi:ABC transporter permease [Ensifer sp. YR511]|uniref:ABC transporter permease n=1 Tax=Ensifer sp. YR511 TaxID=1855294 RepID=UPI00087E9DEA|nr:ABC transporter permease [Ensifer sp. YR511]SDO17139.1 peptide/nickel transport system permease protein [Ensifer sp. YR511]